MSHQYQDYNIWRPITDPNPNSFYPRPVTSTDPNSFYPHSVTTTVISVSPIPPIPPYVPRKQDDPKKNYQIPWAEQFCWQGKSCKWSICKRSHPNKDITCACTERNCKNLHDDTESGWSDSRDKEIQKKISNMQKTPNTKSGLPHYEIQKKIIPRIQADKQKKLHDTAFCVPPGINSVQVVINGKSFDIGHETIGPLLGLLEDYGHTFSDDKKEGDGEKQK